MAKIEHDQRGSTFIPDKSGGHFDNASAWMDDGCLVICTGDDGFGLHLDDEEFEQFIEYLREVRRRPRLVRRGIHGEAFCARCGKRFPTNAVGQPTPDHDRPGTSIACVDLGAYVGDRDG